MPFPAIITLDGGCVKEKEAFIFRSIFAAAPGTGIISADFRLDLPPAFSTLHILLSFLPSA